LNDISRDYRGTKSLTQVLHVGFDDTDSLRGSCTTYLATLIITQIFDQVEFLDFPQLVRLNPNIPFKTRGNGSIALQITGNQTDLEECQEFIINTIKKHAQFQDENTNPGIVFVKGTIPTDFTIFAKRAMWDVIPLEDAKELGELPNVQQHLFKLGRGIIGASAAIGTILETDYTFEHISYRQPINFGTERPVDNKSIIRADKTTPLTFNNVDYEYHSILITPRGPDPVFAGVRGETIEEIRKAWSLMKPLEPIMMKMIFRTNQHTNNHFQHQFKIDNLKPHLSVYVEGKVITKPRYIEGGHLIFTIEDETGKVDCAVYEPTKKYRKIMSNLLVNDRLVVYGGVRPAEKDHPVTINIERIKILELEPKITYENPFCDECNTRLKSAGKNKGYKCPNCSEVYREKQTIETRHPRKLTLQDYITPLIAQRHLTRPYSREKQQNSPFLMKKKQINDILEELVKYNQNHYYNKKI
jgi:tRNA(Ile2)-agmatinylcytidine synthase